MSLDWRVSDRAGCVREGKGYKWWRYSIWVNSDCLNDNYIFDKETVECVLPN